MVGCIECGTRYVYSPLPTATDALWFGVSKPAFNTNTNSTKIQQLNGAGIVKNKAQFIRQLNSHTSSDPSIHTIEDEIGNNNATEATTTADDIDKLFECDSVHSDTDNHGQHLTYAWDES